MDHSSSLFIGLNSVHVGIPLLDMSCFFFLLDKQDKLLFKIKLKVDWFKLDLISEAKAVKINLSWFLDCLTFLTLKKKIIIIKKYYE